MSTSIASPDYAAPKWKQEVNRRLAAHKSRTGFSPEPATPTDSLPEAGSRASQIAARVAARYAKAPSYSQLLAEEARAAVRAAQTASQAARNAQTAAESVLAGLEADLEAGLEAEILAHSRVEPAAPPVQPLPHPAPNPASQPFAIRWDADLPARAPETTPAVARDIPVSSRIPLERWREPDAPGREAIEVVEAAQPIHANLIQFPHELVATRKVRPRLAEGPHAAADEPDRQLSIFEVDPGTISTEPAVTVAEPSGSPWPVPEWTELGDEPGEEPAIQTSTKPLQLAPLGLRAMAAVVDAALIVSACMAAVSAVIANAQAVPALHRIELGFAMAMAVIGVLYHAFFFTFARSAPGMKWARISLCTFDDQVPTRTQKFARLGALLLSLLPVGLGVAWAIFDEDHLSWHDRLSKTYLRKE